VFSFEAEDDILKSNGGSMRRLVVTAASVLMTFLSGTAAFACGDKLLAIARGVRFQHIQGAHQASLVIYSAGTQNGAALDSARLQTTLKRSVRNLQVVHDGSQLDQALKSGQVDVVLVDFTDVTGIAGHLQSAPSKPVILPVLIKPSKAEFAAAQKAYKFALKAGDDIEYLTAIDEVMKSNLRTSARS
jgi:ABC-type amino acid transport substrate-binding protein